MAADEDEQQARQLAVAKTLVGAGILTELANQLAANTKAMGELALAINERPTHSESEVRRKTGLALGTSTAVATVIVAAMIQDEHAERCGPGYRAEYIITKLIEPGASIRTSEDFQKLAQEGTPEGFCEVAFPFHTHTDDSWPSSLNYVGLGIYLLVIVLLITAITWAMRTAKKLNKSDSQKSAPKRRIQDGTARPYVDTGSGSQEDAGLDQGSNP